LDIKNSIALNLFAQLVCIFQSIMNQQKAKAINCG